MNGFGNNEHVSTSYGVEITTRPTYIELPPIVER